MPTILQTHDSCPNLSTKELLRAVALAATMLREERSQGECEAIAASLFQYVECLAARMPDDRWQELPLENLNV